MSLDCISPPPPPLVLLSLMLLMLLLLLTESCMPGPNRITGETTGCLSPELSRLLSISIFLLIATTGGKFCCPIRAAEADRVLGAGVGTAVSGCGRGGCESEESDGEEGGCWICIPKPAVTSSLLVLLLLLLLLLLEEEEEEEEEDEVLS